MNIYKAFRVHIRIKTYLFKIFIFSVTTFAYAQLNNNEVLKKIKNINDPALKKIINDNFDSINNNIKKGKKTSDVESQQVEIKEILDKSKSVRNSEFGADNNESVSNKININEIENVNQSNIGSKDKNSNNSSIEGYNDIGITSDLNFFGYDIFKNDQKIFENSASLTTDPNYQIGPGDEIIIMLWGQTVFNESFVVTKDGYLFIDDIGQVFVNGLTIQKLEKKLLNMFKRVHSSLDSSLGNPSTFFDISLGSSVSRPKRIFVVGEVNNPGAYFMNQSTSLFSSLYYFGGPNTNGSLREIKLIRNGKEKSNIDFYDFLLTGQTNGDVRLFSDDVIFIPPRKNTVKIRGEISRQAIYELKEEESLKDVIKIAGGLKNTTYRKMIQIDRIIEPENRIDNNENRKLIDLNLWQIMNSDKTYKVSDGDQITFYKISDIITNKVSIIGAVTRPGEYALDSGINIKDLIKKADGLLNTAFKERAEIIRINSDNTTSLIDVDLEKALNGSSDHNIALLSDDIVTVFDYETMTFKEAVEITGHVKNPNRLAFKKGMQLYDLLFAGGGFENEEHLRNTYFERAILSRRNKNNFDIVDIPFRVDSVLMGKGMANELLQMGDKVRIFSLNDVKGIYNEEVEITGLVKRQGKYQLSEGMRISDLLFLSGGFNDTTFASKILLERADLVRKDIAGKNSIISFNIDNVLNNKKSDKDLFLKANDKIRIYSNSIFQKEDYVRIEGTVKTSGRYELKKEMTLLDLVLEAGGITDESNEIKYEIARIESKNSHNNNSVKIITGIFRNSINLVEKSNRNRVYLKPYDLIILRPDPFLKKQDLVSINGFVYYPGNYAIKNSREKVTDLIKRAGGLKPEAYAYSSKLIRDGVEVKVSFHEILKNPRSKKNFFIASGDSIVINSRPNRIKIEGEVNAPGIYQYMEGKNFRDYIKTAGGFTEEAARSATIIRLPSGRTKQMKTFTISPKILDGSEIIVGRKVDVEPFSLTEYVTNLTAIYADLTQAYLMIILAGR